MISARLSDSRAIEEVPPSVENSKRGLAEKTMREDASYTALNNNNNPGISMTMMHNRSDNTMQAVSFMHEPTLVDERHNIIASGAFASYSFTGIKERGDARWGEEDDNNPENEEQEQQKLEEAIIQEKKNKQLQQQQQLRQRSDQKKNQNNQDDDDSLNGNVDNESDHNSDNNYNNRYRHEARNRHLRGIQSSNNHQQMQQLQQNQQQSQVRQLYGITGHARQQYMQNNNHGSANFRQILLQQQQQLFQQQWALEGMMNRFNNEDISWGHQNNNIIINSNHLQPARGSQEYESRQRNSRNGVIVYRNDNYNASNDINNLDNSNSSNNGNNNRNIDIMNRQNVMQQRIRRDRNANDNHINEQDNNNADSRPYQYRAQEVVENIEQIEQQRQLNRIAQAIQNSRRQLRQDNQASLAVDSDPTNNSSHVVILDEDDRARCRLVFNKAVRHQLYLCIIGLLLLVIFFVDILTQAIWIIAGSLSAILTISSGKQYKKMPDIDSLEKQRKRQALFTTIETGILSGVMVMMFLFFEVLKEPIILLFVYTPFIHILWWLLFTPRISDFLNRHVELLLRVYAVAQIFLYSVEHDEIVSWTWVSAFLPTWILLSSLGFYVLGLILLMICSLYYYSIGETDKYQVKGLLWCLLVSMVMIGGCAYFMYGLLKRFQSYELDTLRMSLLVIIAGNILTILYCLACKEDLQIFVALANSENLFNGKHVVKFVDAPDPSQIVQEVSRDDNAERQRYNSQMLQQQQQQQQQSISVPLGVEPQIEEPKKVKVIVHRTRLLPKSLPPFLLKFSSTYFQKCDVSKEFEKDKRKREETTARKLGSRNELPVNNNNNNNSQRTDHREEKQQQGQKKDINNNNNLSSRSRQSKSSSQMTEKNSCAVCFDQIPDCVILECGHGGLCYQCGVDIWKKTGECYLCRQTISKLVQIDVGHSHGKFKQIMAVAELKELSEGHNEEDIVSNISHINENNNAQDNSLSSSSFRQQRNSNNLAEQQQQQQQIPQINSVNSIVLVNHQSGSLSDRNQLDQNEIIGIIKPNNDQPNNINRNNNNNSCEENKLIQGNNQNQDVSDQIQIQDHLSHNNESDNNKQANETDKIDKFSDNHTQDCNLGGDEDNQGMSKPAEQVSSFSNQLYLKPEQDKDDHSVSINQKIQNNEGEVIKQINEGSQVTGKSVVISIDEDCNEGGNGISEQPVDESSSMQSSMPVELISIVDDEEEEEEQVEKQVGQTAEQDHNDQDKIKKNNNKIINSIKNQKELTTTIFGSVSPQQIKPRSLTDYHDHAVKYQHAVPECDVMDETTGSLPIEPSTMTTQQHIRDTLTKQASHKQLKEVGAFVGNSNQAIRIPADNDCSNHPGVAVIGQRMVVEKDLIMFDDDSQQDKESNYEDQK